MFVFWRGFFEDPNALEEPGKVMEQTKIYPLGKQDSAKPMDSRIRPACPSTCCSDTAFDMFARFIDHEYVDPRNFEMRGLAAALGIVKGQPFAPNDAARKLLDAAAKTAARMANTLPVNRPK